MVGQRNRVPLDWGSRKLWLKAKAMRKVEMDGGKDKQVRKREAKG